MNKDSREMNMYIRDVTRYGGNMNFYSKPLRPIEKFYRSGDGGKAIINFVRDCVLRGIYGKWYRCDECGNFPKTYVYDAEEILTASVVIHARRRRERIGWRDEEQAVGSTTKSARKVTD